MTCTEKQFLEDVGSHKMTVLKNEGVYRHLRFSKSNSTSMRFDLLTWPRHLCFTGDMGTYVFAREGDMFGFFGIDRALPEGKVLDINPDYWHEKLVAVDSRDGSKKWSEKVFAQRARECLEEWLQDSGLPEAKKLKAMQDFENEALWGCCDGKAAAYNDVMGFEVEGECPLQDFWEVDTDEYTFRFIWCCYAIVWGIKKYNEAWAAALKGDAV